MSDFYIVDVFTQGRFTGNPLAVFTNGERYSDTQMQVLARELNFSETTFLLSQNPDGSYPVRIFTPVTELPFAGHPTLGSAFIIQQTILRDNVPAITLDLPIGHVSVQLTYRNDGQPDILTMRQHSPTFLETYPSELFEHALGLAPMSASKNLPVQRVTTGLPFVIVPLQSLADVQQACLHFDRFQAIPGIEPGTNVLIFCKQTEEAGHDLHVRVFVPELGVSEDPATGSAGGCLCAYLLRYSEDYGSSHQTAATSVYAQAEQGYEIGRRALLFLSGVRTDTTYEIYVGGRVEWMAQASLCQDEPN